MRHRRGFTLVELLIAIGILGIIGRFIVVNLLHIAAEADLDATANVLATYIREAQIRSVNLIDDTDWGVRVSNSATPEIFLYKVDCINGGANNLTAITSANKFQDFYKGLRATLRVTNPSLTQSKNFIFKRATGELYDDNGSTCGPSTGVYVCGNLANDKLVALELLSNSTKKRTIAVNCYGKTTITN